MADHPLTRVYPRAGGETGEVSIDPLQDVGLSPRGRGNRHSSRPSRPACRSIPARAGKPMATADCTSRRRVYPRAGGETVIRAARAALLVGLSPRGRGNPWPRPIARPAGGSIPARAGKPGWRRPKAVSSGVYPRAGGETIVRSPALIASSGLSPRGRGNRLSVERGHAGFGSIPARAGKPRSPPRFARDCGVYPRAGGETFITARFNTTLSGLSPRGRGNLAMADHPLTRFRSIPARAGKPSHRRCRSRSCAVYPRAGGETRCNVAALRVEWGLSPRGRGNRHESRGRCVPVGSIPARAGKPDPQLGGGAAGMVYPRAGGETPSGSYCMT